jgi:hypothetical protein
MDRACGTDRPVTSQRSHIDQYDRSFDPDRSSQLAKRVYTCVAMARPGIVI